MNKTTKCDCGFQKPARIGKCWRCVKREMEEVEIYCDCGKEISEEQLRGVGVCNECK